MLHRRHQPGGPPCLRCSGTASGLLGITSSCSAVAPTTGCRSIGDADLKAQGVSAEAEAAELALGPADSFLIVATDGLWDKLRWATGRRGVRLLVIGCRL